MQTKRIPLVDRTGSAVAHALVDADQFAALSKLKWHRDSAGYARTHTVPNHPERMHRMILGLVRREDHGDHINGDRLDNRRSNLRVVTHAQNMQNIRTRHPGSSRFRGVYWMHRGDGWGAQAMHAGKSHWIGCFDNELAAVLAIDEWRLANVPFAVPDPALAGVPLDELDAARASGGARVRGPRYKRARC